MKIMFSAESAARISRFTKVELTKFQANPRKFLLGLVDSDYLERLVRAYSKDFHDKGESALADAQFDALQARLKKLNPKSDALKEVGAAPTGRRKVELPYPLYSLDKVKPGEASFAKWVLSHPGPYILSDKEDGISILLVYGDTIKAFTRGNGTVGQDVSHLVPHIGVPLKGVPKGTAIRCELLMSEAAFKNYEAKFANARNLVAGLANKIKTDHEALGHVDHVAYEIISPRMKPSEALRKLKSWGFNVVPHRLAESITEDFMSKYLAHRKAKSIYAIDGIVIEQDKKTIRRNGNPDYARAFKETTEDSTAEATVKEVVWTASKYGTLKPVIHIEPIKLSGVTISKVTGHNAYFIMTGLRKKSTDLSVKPRPIGPGSVILITRSGDVIPYVMKIIKPARKPQMPSVPYEYVSETKIDIKLVKGEHDETTALIKAKRITSFFRTLKVENIALSTVQKFIESGLDSIIKIIRAKPERFLEVPGVKERMANKLYDSIQDKIKNGVVLPTLMDGSGIFGSGIGTRKVEPVLEMYPNIVDLGRTKTQAQLVKMLLNVDGFSTLTAEKFAKGLPKFITWLDRSKLKIAQPRKVKVTGDSLSGQTVTLTGFRNAELVNSIQSNGGAVANFSSATTILVVPNASYENKKTEGAKAKGVKVMPEATFRSKYRV